MTFLPMATSLPAARAVGCFHYTLSELCESWPPWTELSLPLFALDTAEAGAGGTFFWDQGRGHEANCWNGVVCAA